MNRSEQINELAAALAKAQGAIPPIPKNRVAKIPSQKGAYSYKYADMSDVLSIVTPTMSRHGLSITQPIMLVDGKMVLETMILHESGQWMSGTYPLASYDRPQEQGSEITYARRYALTSLLGIHADEDEDGALASESERHAKEKQPYEKAFERAPLVDPSVRPRHVVHVGASVPQPQAPSTSPAEMHGVTLGGSQAGARVVLPAGPGQKMATEKQIKLVWAKAKKLGFDDSEAKRAIESYTGKQKSDELTARDIDILIAEFDKRASEQSE